MYEVFCNQNKLVIHHSPPVAKQEYCLVIQYRGKTKHLHAYIDKLEKSENLGTIWLVHADPARVWSDFSSLFQPVEAAGGIVINPAGEWLFIVRNGILDLPKGKLDPGEDYQAAALREVQEETGIQNLRLGPELAVTWHIYRIDKRRYLKKTVWFQLACDNPGEGKPQAEEGITRVLWRPPLVYLEEGQHTYRNLKEMIRNILRAQGQI